MVRRRAALCDDIVVARAAALLLAPPNRLIVEIVAPQQRCLQQATVTAAPGLLKNRRTMIQPVHPVHLAGEATICVGGHIAQVVIHGHALNDGVVMISNDSGQI